MGTAERRPRSARARRVAAALGATLALGATACGVDNPPAPLPRPDFEYFVCAVQPVLDRDCSFGGCHGSVDRGMQVLSPSRMRIASEYGFARLGVTDEEVEEGIHPPLTAIELSFNYDQARAFAAASDDEAPQLLSRPLAVSAGGRYHAPAGDVFSGTEAPGYQVLERWLAGATGEECP